MTGCGHGYSAKVGLHCNDRRLVSGMETLNIQISCIVRKWCFFKKLFEQKGKDTKHGQRTVLACGAGFEQSWSTLLPCLPFLSIYTSLPNSDVEDLIKCVCTRPLDVEVLLVGVVARLFLILPRLTLSTHADTLFLSFHHCVIAILFIAISKK